MMGLNLEIHFAHKPEMCTSSYKHILSEEEEMNESIVAGNLKLCQRSGG